MNYKTIQGVIAIIGIIVPVIFVLSEQYKELKLEEVPAKCVGYFN